jgi:hypothetical protein
MCRERIWSTIQFGALREFMSKSPSLIDANSLPANAAGQRYQALRIKNGLSLYIVCASAARIGGAGQLQPFDDSLVRVAHLELSAQRIL